MSAATVRTAVGSVGGDVTTALRLTARRRDARAVAVLASIGYLVTFLFVTGDLSYRPDVGVRFLVVADPVERLFARTGPASFGAIGMIDAGVVRLLVSPFNLVIGLGIAVLVGVNLALSSLAIRRPAECGIGAGSGVIASLPALLSGTICCGPVVLLAVGVQASAALMTVFAWLLPLGTVLLLVSLAYVATRIDVGVSDADRSDAADGSVHDRH